MGLMHLGPPAGAFYMRLVGRPLDVYQYLEPLYNDYRKVRQYGWTNTRLEVLLRRMAVAAV